MMKKTYNHILVWESFSIAFALSVFALLSRTIYRGSGNSRYSASWTPGFLLKPFKPLWKLNKGSDIEQLCWIFLQNVLNITLVSSDFPTPLSISKFAENKKILLLVFLWVLESSAYAINLGLFLWVQSRLWDWWFVDQLTLGGYLAWLLYKRLHKNKIRN